MSTSIAEAHADYRSGLIDNYLEAMDLDEIEKSFDDITDMLAEIWKLHEKDEKKRNQLIVQQLESCLLNVSETAIEIEYGNL